MTEIKYVQLESADFLSDPDFQLMSSEERGIYCSVIFYMYLNDGKILDNAERIKKLCNADKWFATNWENVRKKFVEKNGYLTHKRVRKELAKAKKFIQSQRRAGLRGAEKRWAGHNNPISPAITKPIANKVKESKVKESKKNKYKDFVFLSDDEYKKLVERFGEQQTEKKIDALNDYIGSRGKKYKSHYHTILMWSKKDAPDQQPKVCVVCRAVGHKYQIDKNGKQIFLCEDCLGFFGSGSWGHLPLGQIERIVLAGKAKR